MTPKLPDGRGRAVAFENTRVEYTRYVYEYGTTTREVMGRSGSRFGGIPGAGEDGQARVFGEGRIGLRELAEEELRAFAGFDEAGVKSIGAEAEARIGVGR